MLFHRLVVESDWLLCLEPLIVKSVATPLEGHSLVHDPAEFPGFGEPRLSTVSISDVELHAPLGIRLLDQCAQ